MTSGIAPAQRLTGERRRRIAGQLREEYERGSSIRALAGETGRSYGSIHRLLTESGAVLRTRGGAHGATRPTE